MATESIFVSTSQAVLGWDQQAAGYEVIACTEHWPGLPQHLHQQLEPLVPMTLRAEQPLLFISFDGLMERRYNAFLLSQQQRVLLCYEQDGELCSEFIGAMSPDNFWAFLDSFPNVYRYLDQG